MEEIRLENQEKNRRKKPKNILEEMQKNEEKKTPKKC